MKQAAEVRVGIFVIVVLILAVFIGSNLKGGFGGARGDYTFEIWFDDAPSVGSGSPARLAGVDIGEVVSKDALPIQESMFYEPSQTAGLLPLDRVKVWYDGEPGRDDYVEVLVERKPVAEAELRRQPPYGPRNRTVARLEVRIKRPSPGRDPIVLYQNYRYEIQGGIVFGERQLNISDTLPNGMPIPAAVLGFNIRDLSAEKGRRVAVLGLGPASLDRVVSNVEEALDAETTARLKQTVTNIERATNEAGQLTAVLRETVEANQGNADRMFNNFAAASEELRSGLVETRAMARGSLSNINQATATANRALQRNQYHLDNIARNLDTTTGAFARVARRNEHNLDTTLKNVAALTGDLRGTLGENRTGLTRVTTSLANAADEVRGLTADSRKQLNTTLTTVNETVATARDTLRGSSDEMAKIVENTATITTAVSENITPMMASVRATTGHVEQISKNVAELTGDQQTKQILTNVQETTAEARAMMGDLRSLTGDKKLQDDLRRTIRGAREVTERFSAGGISGLAGLAGFRPSASTTVYYSPRRDAWEAEVDLTMAMKGNRTVHLGVDNLTDDPVLNAQLGRELLLPGLRARYGFYRSQLGFGLDYLGLDNLTLRTDLYDTRDPKLNGRLLYQLPFGGLSAMAGVEDVFDRSDWILGGQVGKSFR